MSLKRKTLLKWCLLVGIVIIAFLGIASIFAWKVLKSSEADLINAKSNLTSIESQGPSSINTHKSRLQSEQNINTAIEDSQNALNSLQSSLALSMLGTIPYLNTERQGIISLAQDTNSASKLALGLVVNLDQLAESKSLSGGRIPLNSLLGLENSTKNAALILQKMDQPESGLFGPVGAEKVKFNSDIAKAVTRLNSATLSLNVARSFVGGSGKRTYLVVGLNNAEMRDEGMPLSVATVTFSNGTFTTTQASSIQDMELHAPVNVAIPEGTQKVFGELDPTYLWQSVGATANFQWTGATMIAMDKQATGQQVDGVIAIDVPALQDLLSVTGPVNVPGLSTPLTSSNAGTLLLHDLYTSLPASSQQITRHELVAAAADAVLARLKHGSGINLIQLGQELFNAAAGRHFILYSSNSFEEGLFIKDGFGGVVDSSNPSRTFHIAVENATATKLDYFIQPKITMNVNLTKYGNAIIDTSITVTNSAPIGAKPSYQLGPDNINSTKPGEYVGRVEFWGPQNSEQFNSVSESGLRLNEIPFIVEPGNQTTLHMQTIIPDAIRNGTLTLRFVPQPRLNPVEYTININAPDWKLKGTPQSQINFTLDQSQSFAWNLASK